jgi:hypothetical protein
MTLDELEAARVELDKLGKVAVCLLVKPSFAAQMARDAASCPRVDMGGGFGVYRVDMFCGLPVRAVLPEAWPEPFRFVFDDDPFPWSMFNGRAFHRNWYATHGEV